MPSLSGPGTDWINEAEARANAWPDTLLAQLLALWPYPPDTKVRPDDWLILISHTAHRRQEGPLECAQRLASYVTTYAERYQVHPDPAAVLATQTSGATP